VNVH
jgi:hypothetical protein